MGDFNGDGHLDWAVSNGGDSSIWIYLGKGDGTANLPTIIPLTGLGPVWLTAVDLRGNGMLDLVVAEADSGTVGVLLGNGDGTFQTEVEYTVPNPPLFVLGGDFNVDGKLDIAVGMIGSTATGPVAVLPGDGQGHLGAALYTAAAQPSVGAWLATADLNGDGKPDLVVVDPDDIGPNGGAQVYLNNGNGTFTAGQLFFSNYGILDVSEEAFSVALADVNGDGCTDAVVTDAFGLAFVFTGNCKGTFNVPEFTTATLGDIGAAIQLVDVNKDGKLDLVTSGILLGGPAGPGYGGAAGNLVSVLFGDGTGHFGPGRVYRGEPSMYSLAVGDLNGDGFPDVVTANQDSNSASVFLNDGTGAFGDPQGEPIGYNLGATNSPETPFIFADVDGNGTLDMVLLESPPESPGNVEITVMLNDGTGKFSLPIKSPWSTPTSTVPGNLVLADFRNTGQLDALAVAGDFYAPSINFSPNIGGGKFGPSTMSTPTGAEGQLAVGDFNGDGKLDFVTVSANINPDNISQQLSVFLGNGDGTFRAGQSFSFAAGDPGDVVAVYAGDFNRDGKLDLLVLVDGLYELLGNGDGTFQQAVELFPTFGGFVLVDLNRDGWPDILAATDEYGNPETYAPEFSVFLGQPDGTFKYLQTSTPYLANLQMPHLFLTVISSSLDAVLGDFNGDGNPDLAVFQYPDVDSSQVFFQILYGNGDGTFTPSYDSFALNKLAFVPQFAADVNGDGLADLVELDAYTSSFNVIKAAANAPALQLNLLTVPVTGSTGYGRITLNTPSASTTLVTLTASDPSVTVPSVSIPAGSVSQDFQFSLNSGFNPLNVFSIQAQLGSTTATAYGYQSGPPSPLLEADPQLLLFGDVPIGSSSTQSVTLKNIGSAVLNITSISKVFGSSTESNDCGSNLAVGASCVAQVTFAPIDGGQSTGGLNIAGNIPGGSAQVGLVALGLNPLQIVPCCLEFFDQPGSATVAPQTVRVTNMGSTTIDFNTTGGSVGDGFSQTNNCSALAPNASCQVIVTFAPTQPGLEATTVLLTNDTNDPLSIPVSGSLTDFEMEPISSSITVSAGESGTTTGFVGSPYYFNGTVALSCSGAPAGATCSISPSSLNVALYNGSQYSLTVTTTAPSTSSIKPNGRPGRFAILPCLALLGLIALRVNSPRLPRHATVVAVLLLALLMVSCGGGSGNAAGVGGGGTGGGGTGGSSGTPVGSYSLTVTGTAGTTSHTTSFTLNVQ